MLDGSGWAVAFSPTTGGGESCGLLPQEITISNGSSKASLAAFFLGGVFIGYLLLVAGVDLALAEGLAGIVQGDTCAFGFLAGVLSAQIIQSSTKAPVLSLPSACEGDGRAKCDGGQVGVDGGRHAATCMQSLCRWSCRVHTPPHRRLPGVLQS